MYDKYWVRVTATRTRQTVCDIGPQKLASLFKLNGELKFAVPTESAQYHITICEVFCQTVNPLPLLELIAAMIRYVKVQINIFIRFKTKECCTFETIGQFFTVKYSFHIFVHRNISNREPRRTLYFMLLKSYY